MSTITQLRPLDLPWVFISFREPNANENWLRLKKQIPEAVRSHGVVGFDEAHRAAAAKVNGDFLFTLDGDSTVYDNWLYQPLNIKLAPNSAWCWRSRNIINGLAYGNGGVKLWHRSVIENMKSHTTGVDFCWQSNYYSLRPIVGETNPGCSPRQAFIAGCREGIKLLLDEGKIQSINQLRCSWNEYNRSAWITWCVRGAHHEIWRWAAFGARYSAVKFLLGRWPHTSINNWDFLSQQFDEVCSTINLSFEWDSLLNEKYVQNNNNNLSCVIWKKQFEILGIILKQLLYVNLPNIYEEQYWQCIDNCYLHKLDVIK